MGVYAERDLNGEFLNSKQKAKQLIESGAEVMPPNFVWHKELAGNLLCVVENGAFDAAAIVTDQAEFLRFKQGLSGRKVTWLCVPRAERLR